jgi:hypothetical protein
MYAKADRNSSVNTVTEPGMSKVGVDYSTIGLNDKDTYWFVIHAEGRNLTTGVRFYYGFVHEDDVEASTPEPMALRVPNHPSEES